MVSSSAGEGPGPVISRGLTERRVFRRSMASGTAVSFIGINWRSNSTRWCRLRGRQTAFRVIETAAGIRPPSRASDMFAAAAIGIAGADRRQEGIQPETLLASAHAGPEAI